MIDGNVATADEAPAPPTVEGQLTLIEEPVIPPVPAPSLDVMGQLKQAKELHELGVLTDEEFAQAKVCGSRRNLHTHHKTYKALGQEPQHHLVVLCADHHKACHEFIRAWRVGERKSGRRRLSDYTLTMKYMSREKKKLKKLVDY